MAWVGVDRGRNKEDLFGTKGDELYVRAHGSTPGIDWTGAQWAGEVRDSAGTLVASFSLHQNDGGDGVLDVTMKLTATESAKVTEDVEHKWSIRNTNATVTEVVSGLMITEAPVTQ